MRWIDLKTLPETKIWLNKQNEEHHLSIAQGKFWGSEIKRFKQQPNERLEIALQNLPLPGAFREAALALRMRIRDTRKKSENFEGDASLLYHLATIQSFMKPYSEVLKTSGYNVFEQIPGGVIAELEFTYDFLGYKELLLLNKTDRKWIVELWGEPTTHSNLNALYSAVWKEYELLIKREEISLQGWVEDQHGVRSINSTPPPLPRRTPPPLPNSESS